MRINRKFILYLKVCLCCGDSIWEAISGDPWPQDTDASGFTEPVSGFKSTRLFLSSSVIPFSSCPQSLPASESIPMSQLFAWGGQSTGPHTLVKWCLKFSKPGFSNTWTMNFQLFKLVLDKAEEPEIKLPTSAGSSKKQESSRKNIYFCFYWLCQCL